jgi:hypothetical protein
MVGRIIDRIVYGSGVLFILLIFLISVNTIRRCIANDDPVVSVQQEFSYDRAELTGATMEAALLGASLEYDSVRMVNQGNYIGRLIFELREGIATGRFEVVELCGCPSGEEKMIINRALKTRLINTKIQ